MKIPLTYPLTINAWITPGNQANRVKRTLTKKVVPRPCFRNTAKGGNRMFKIIVRIDILYFHLDYNKYHSLYRVSLTQNLKKRTLSNSVAR